MTVNGISEINYPQPVYKSIDDLVPPCYGIEKLEIVQTYQGPRLKATLVDNIYTFLPESFMREMTFNILTELQTCHLLLLVFEEDEKYVFCISK